jgi:hypothetical protein
MQEDQVNWNLHKSFSPQRKKIHQIIFGYETFGGKLFDIVLLIAIVLRNCYEIK